MSCLDNVLDLANHVKCQLIPALDLLSSLANQARSAIRFCHGPEAHGLSARVKALDSSVPGAAEGLAVNAKP